jgi:hypothetical protein
MYFGYYLSQILHWQVVSCYHQMSPDLNSSTYHFYTGSSKKNAGIIKTYHSKTVKHIKMIQVLKCGKRTQVLDMLS